jgi:uncharacterized membrane protein YkoI
MSDRTRKTVTVLGGLAALALGGSAIASAADNNNSSSSSSNSASSSQPARPPNGKHPPGRHIGANGKREQALSADVAAKVKKAALAKVPGGTVVRTETDADHGSPYEAHVRKPDGSEVEVLVNQAFEVTAVNEMGPGGPGGPPPRQP